MVVIGVDIGGASIKAGLVRNGKVLSKAVVGTHASKGEKQVIENIIKAIESVNTSRVKGIGIGCPGPLDYKKGIILNPVNLPFRNTNLKKILEKRFKLPVYIDNDASVFVLGEAKYGSAKGYKDVIGLTLGTGVGGGIIVDGKLLHGRLNAGELGHMTINYDSERDSRCGNRGCLEEHLSARAILREAGIIGVRAKSPSALFELASDSHKKSLYVWHRIGEYLGIGIANLVYCFDPDVVVIGGQIADAWRFFSHSMKQTVKDRCMIKHVKIRKARLRNPGIIGASCLAD